MPKASFLNREKFPAHEIEILKYKAGSPAESSVKTEFFNLFETTLGKFPLAAQKQDFGKSELLEVPDIHLIVCRHNKKVVGGLVLECYPCRYAFLRDVFAISAYKNKEIEAELIVYLKKYVDEQLNDPALTSQKTGNCAFV